eukprot:g8274.t1
MTQCPGGETGKRITQWRDCNPDHDGNRTPVDEDDTDRIDVVPALAPRRPKQQPIPPPSTRTVQAVEEVDGTTKEKDCLSDIC